MKMKSFFVAALLVTATVSVAVVSCKKDKEIAKASSLENEQSIEINMDEYLISFKKKLLSAQKGGETISFEQAKRDLGNLLNFDFDDANYATDVFHYDTLRASLSINDGQVDLSQLAIVYQTLLVQIRETYHQVELPEKSVFSIYCGLDEKRSRDDETENLIFILTTRGYNGTDTDDYSLRAGNKAGACDGTLVGILGAPENVTNIINQHYTIEIPGCPAGSRLYWTENAASWIQSFDNDNMILSTAPRGYRLFYATCMGDNGSYTLPRTCLPESEILFYCNQSRLLTSAHKDWFHNPIPNSHVITNTYIAFMHTESWHYAWWRLNVWHAKPNCTESSPII